VHSAVSVASQIRGNRLPVRGRVTQRDSDRRGKRADVGDGLPASGGLLSVTLLERYLSEFAKDCQAAAGNVSVPPSRSLVSRIKIAWSASPTSTQLPPLPPVYVATRQAGSFAVSSPSDVRYKLPGVPW
jgi:hypothetical protein